jgi:hypothetical protein
MRKIFFSQDRFFCFTPEVMLATFLIEIFLAVYVFIRYRIAALGRLTAVILVLLAAFQISEYQICGGANQIFWSKTGYTAITALPALGLALVSLVTGKKNFLKLGYALMFLYILIFLFAPKAISGAVCEKNYLVFYTNQQLSWTYTVYYFGFLILAIWEAWENRTDKNKNLLNWIIAGYLSFILPMGIVYILSPAARQAIPSIMCGFALILAFILAFKVAPKYKNLI